MAAPRNLLLQLRSVLDLEERERVIPRSLLARLRAAVAALEAHGTEARPLGEAVFAEWLDWAEHSGWFE